DLAGADQAGARRNDRPIENKPQGVAGAEARRLRPRRGKSDDPRRGHGHGPVAAIDLSLGDLLMNVGKLAESTGKVHDSCYFASQRVSSQCAVEGREVVRSGVMKGYANPHLVVSPRELAPMLGGVGAIPLLVLDLRPPEAYAAGHIPGAIHLDLWGVSLIDTDP